MKLISGFCVAAICAVGVGAQTQTTTTQTETKRTVEVKDGQKITIIGCLEKNGDGTYMLISPEFGSLDRRELEFGPIPELDPPTDHPHDRQRQRVRAGRPGLTGRLGHEVLHVVKNAMTGPPEPVLLVAERVLE